MNSIIVNSHSNKPIYQQLYDQISNQILLKELAPGTQLHSIRNTAKELRVSIITVKKTWELLELNKYIYTVAGKGSYVSDNSDIVLQDKKVKLVEDSLKEVIENSKNLGITKTELLSLISDLYTKWDIISIEGINGHYILDKTGS